MISIFRLSLSIIIVIFIFIGSSSASTESLSNLKVELLSYFPIVNGKVIKIEQDHITLDKGIKDGLKKGQRINLYEESVPLLHPVTGQIIGKSEKNIGTAEIISTEMNIAMAKVLDSQLSSKKTGELLFKIPKSKIKALFAQGNTEWAIGEAYYRDLKSTERFELIDAPINIISKESLLKDAKNADILILLQTKKKNSNVLLSQEIYWIKDNKLLSSSSIELSPIVINELRKKYASLVVPEGHTLLSYRLSRGINRIATFNFDNNPYQVLIASDNEISLYNLEVDLKLKSNYKIPLDGEILWLDTADIDKDGAGEVIFSLKRGGSIVSFIIKFRDGKFEEISRLNDLFLRVYDNKLIGQSFSPSTGFDGEIFHVIPFKAFYQKGEPLKMPIKANLYDFYILGDMFFKWEDEGFLVVYDKKGIPIWRSQQPMGFGSQYEKMTGVSVLSLGKWNVYSRIKAIANGIIVIDKKPLIDFVNISLLGYRSSKLQLLQWTGVGIEQIDITEEISGEIIDYSISNDRLFVLVKPPFGLNPKRLLQGESPFETMLHILSFNY